MHLVVSRSESHRTGLYQNRRTFTRVNTLPFVFRKLRVHRNLSAAGLAKKFGFTERYVRDVENGIRFPSLRYCLLCADLFGANPGWVKTKWAHDAVERFDHRIHERLGI